MSKKDRVYRITVEERQENNKYKELEKFNTNCSIVSGNDCIHIMANKVDSSYIIEVCLNIINSVYEFTKSKTELSFKEYITVLTELLLEDEEKDSIEIDVNELINQMFNNN